MPDRCGRLARTRLDVTYPDLARKLGVTVGCLAGAGIARGRLVTASWRSRALIAGSNRRRSIVAAAGPSKPKGPSSRAMSWSLLTPDALLGPFLFAFSASDQRHQHRPER